MTRTPDWVYNIRRQLKEAIESISKPTKPVNGRKETMKSDGMRSDGSCGNGMNVENHNKPCVGSSRCEHAFQYGVAKPTFTMATDYKSIVSAQYRAVCEKTVEFFREVVKFGALLNEVEEFVGEGRGVGHEGEGLQGWLAENCPEINYKTAQGYKAMASKCAKMIGGGTQAIACLQGREEVIEPTSREAVAIDAQFIEKRDALFEQVESRRQLEKMWFDFCGKGAKKAGRPAGAKAYEFKKDPPEVESARIWAELKNHLECSTLVDSIESLEPRIANIMVGVLKELEKRLMKRANG